jgi:hypothetical protein
MRDVTSKLCRKSVDLLVFLVTSIPKHNNTLCLCIIPSTTESEQAYTVVCNELRKAVCLAVPSIKPCDDEDCVSCGIITALLVDADVAAYVKSQECKECILPVQTAMCDNSKGWGDFAENLLGITSNVCISHATGNVQFVCAVMRQVTFNCAVFQESLRHTVHRSSSFPMLEPTTTFTTSWSIQVKISQSSLRR